MIGRVTWRFQHLDSTQSVAMRLAELGAPHGTVVRAEWQSAGRGRQGRSWIAPIGSSLMFSVLLRPQQPLHHLGTFSVLAGYALIRVLERDYGVRPSIKWPNDVLIDGQKVSGILLQTRQTPFPVAILGMGINVSTPQEKLPPGAISLASALGIAVDRDLLMQSLLAELECAWQAVGEHLPEADLVEINDRLWLRESEVTLVDGHTIHTGMLHSVGSRGELILISDGTERRIISGELTRGPRAISGDSSH